MNKLPDWRDCDLQADMCDPLNPLQQFILTYELENQVELVGSGPFREALLEAITFAEQEATKNIVERVTGVAKQYKDAGFNHSFTVANGLLLDILSLTESKSLMKNGHICGPFCEICKPHIEEIV